MAKKQAAKLKKISKKGLPKLPSKIGANKKLLREEFEASRRMPTQMGIGTAGVA
jgi:hypothetical protein